MVKDYDGRLTPPTWWCAIGAVYGLICSLAAVSFRAASNGEVLATSPNLAFFSGLGGILVGFGIGTAFERLHFIRRAGAVARVYALGGLIILLLVLVMIYPVFQRARE